MVSVQLELYILFYLKFLRAIHKHNIDTDMTKSSQPKSLSRVHHLIVVKI